MSDTLAIVPREQEAAHDEQLVDVDQIQEAPPPPYSATDPQATSVSKQDSEESTDLPELKVYTRRWYILGLFCVMACLQCVVWNTWGPIERGAQYAFDWDSSTIPMFANWGTIMFLLSVVPLSKMVEIDVRNTVLLVSGFIAFGTVLRCCRLFTDNPTIFLTSCHICAILNGIAGVTVMAAPPLISSTWFPASERTTATAINQAANALGNGVAMLVAPALVHFTNGTDSTNRDFTNLFITTSLQSSTEQTKDEVKASIDVYMELLAGISVALFILFLVYFPSKPPLPPAPSSAIARTEFISGIKMLLSNKNVLLACLAYSISMGVMGAWMSVMVYQIGPLGYTDQEIGMMGFASVISQCIMSMLFGYISDRLRHKMKPTLLILLIISTCGFVWLMLMCIPGSGVPHSRVTLYLAIIIATSVSYSCCPLFFEMTVELAYPINESTVAGFLTAMNNLVGMIFLFLFFIPALSEGNRIWMSYTLVGSTFIAIPATALVKEEYNRSNVDEVALRPES